MGLKKYSIDLKKEGLSQGSINQMREVLGTMSVSGMYFDEKFLMKMIKIYKGELTTEDVRTEILRNYNS